MSSLTDTERALLEKLAKAGQPTELLGGDVNCGRSLEQRWLVFFVGNSTAAVITPKGRNAFYAPEMKLKPVGKVPLGFGLTRHKN